MAEIPENLIEWREYLSDGDEGMALEQQEEILDRCIVAEARIGELEKQLQENRPKTQCASCRAAGPETQCDACPRTPWEEYATSEDGLREYEKAELIVANQRIRELELEIKNGDEMYEAQQQKFDGCPHKPIGPGYNACGCSHDRIGDVCALHSPALKAAQAELTAANLRIRELEQERDTLKEKLNTPELFSFRDAVVLEAAHQRERWGSEHDDGKKPADWFWLVGYLAGKALAAHIAQNAEKALHHTISTAAALANWHAAILGKTSMRPGIMEPKS